MPQLGLRAAASLGAAPGSAVAPRAANPVRSAVRLAAAVVVLLVLTYLANYLYVALYTFDLGPDNQYSYYVATDIILMMALMLMLFRYGGLELNATVIAGLQYLVCAAAADVLVYLPSVKLIGYFSFALALSYVMYGWVVMSVLATHVVEMRQGRYWLLATVAMAACGLAVGWIAPSYVGLFTVLIYNVANVLMIALSCYWLCSAERYA